MILKELSIIIPHYNSASKLRRLLDSIPNRNEIQVIVIDDCSNKELEIYQDVKEHYKAWVDFYENNMENKGAGGARNVGLSHALGKWLMFADADDFFIGDLWDIVQDYLDSEADIVYFPPISIIEGTDKSAERHIEYATLAYMTCYLKKRNEFTRYNELAIRYRWASPWSKLIKKSLVDEYHLKFDVVVICDDLTFSKMCGFYAKMIDASWKTFYCITDGKDSLTRTMNSDKEKIRNSVFMKNYNFWYFNLNFIDGCILFQKTGIKKFNYLIKRILHNHFGKFN